MAVHVVEGTGLPELADPECRTADVVDAGEERQGVVCRSLILNPNP
jgi:hypothetical protein